jgi:hypothetical protein
VFQVLWNTLRGRETRKLETWLIEQKRKRLLLRRPPKPAPRREPVEAA